MRVAAPRKSQRTPLLRLLLLAVMAILVGLLASGCFGPGTFRVGTDIQPGTYRNSDSSGGCYWERLSGFSGADGGALGRDVIANGFSRTEQQIVTIAPGDVGFTSSGCGVWTWVAPVAPAPTDMPPPPQPGGGACIESRIDGDFEGWDGDTLFALSNGQFWQQASSSYHYHYAYRPSVTICPVGELYKMWVEGVDESIYVRPLTCMATCIEGSFEGLRNDAVFNLCNGQVWQQEWSYTWYYYWYRPSVTICQVGGGYKMWVEGIDQSVYVVRLR